MSPFEFHQAELEAIERDFETRKQAFARLMPDYAQTVVDAPCFPLPGHIARYLKEATVTLSYFLAHHIATLAEILSLSKSDAISKLREVEQQLGCDPIDPAFINGLPAEMQLYAYSLSTPDKHRACRLETRRVQLLINWQPEKPSS